MIRDLICRGIGFAPGSVKFMPTLGFSIGAIAAVLKRVNRDIAAIRNRQMLIRFRRHSQHRWRRR